MVGSRSIAPGAVVEALLHPDGSEIATIVHELRLPRTSLALVVAPPSAWLARS